MSSRSLFKSLVVCNLAGLLFFGWQLGFSSVCTLLTLGNTLVLIVLYIKQQQDLNHVITLIGKNGESKNKETAIRNYIAHSLEFIREARLAFFGINEIGQDAFSTHLQKIGNEDIKTSLLSAHNKIIELRKMESESRWIAQGVAEIAELKHGAMDIEKYSYAAISTIVKYLGANQGSFFLLKDSEDDSYFELTATYAYGKKKFLEKRVNPGEGILGQVYFEKQVILMTDVPKDYVKITSGLGEALPRCICIIPLMYDGTIHGALEIALFHTLPSSALEYLHKISESIGSTLGAIQNHQRMELLLAESQKMAEEVKTHEEELSANMKELTITQALMKRKQKEMDSVLSSLSTVELDIDGTVLHANEVFLTITGYRLSDIQGKLYKSLIPQQGNDPIQYEIMWSSILSGRSFSGEFRIINSQQKEMWLAGNFTPIFDDTERPYKVMVISLFTTQDKERLFELQEMVAALKNCFPIAEFNPDLSFRSANDLFLTEIGVKRLELKKLSSMNVLANGSFSKVETYLKEIQEHPNNVILDIKDKKGSTKRFHSTLVKINNHADKREKGLLILRNEL